MGARSPSGTNAGGLLETKQTYTNMADDDDDGDLTTEEQTEIETTGDDPEDNTGEPSGTS